MDKIILEGVSNYGKPRQKFADKLATMSVQELEDKTENCIWLSSYAANNPRSDYHWQCNACYAECVRRDNPKIYDKAWKRAFGGME